jgi:hypothetical protein
VSSEYAHGSLPSSDIPQVAYGSTAASPEYVRRATSFTISLFRCRRVVESCSVGRVEKAHDDLPLFAVAHLIDYDLHSVTDDAPRHAAKDPKRMSGSLRRAVIHQMRPLRSGTSSKSTAPEAPVNRSRDQPVKAAETRKARLNPVVTGCSNSPMRASDAA